MVAMQRLKIHNIDLKSPFKGDLGKYGLFKSQLKLDTISSLEEIYKSYPKKFYFKKIQKRI